MQMSKFHPVSIQDAFNAQESHFDAKRAPKRSPSNPSDFA